MKKSQRSRAKPKPSAGPANDLIDPRQVLLTIAGDQQMPPYVRVAACRALLSPAAESKKPEAAEGGPDVVTLRAIEILKAARK